jgi:very-short-patch-repair endonuclease
MRSLPTVSERMLWARLRQDQLGVRFRAQFVIGRFIVDFFCPARALAVEVDGAGHAARADIDAHRDAFLDAWGVRVLRVSNEDVLRDLDEVLLRIRDALDP